jgi:1,4-alpha-glucan branching enzyme
MGSSWRAKQKQIDSIISADQRDPFSILGCHEVDGGVVIRAFLPEANQVGVIQTPTKIIPMEKIHNDGFFQVFIPKAKHFIPVLRLTNHEGHHWDIHDPWSFPPLLGEQDLYFHTEGSHTRAYEKLGTHIIKVNGIMGTSFAVWAPTARRVSIIGNFNQWDGRRHLMEVRGDSGLWELFVPGIGQGEVYKYEIRTAEGFTIDKADPYSFASEVRPKTASVIWNVDNFEWTDKKWMEKRRVRKPLESPMSVYEVHLGSWARNEDNTHRNYKEIAVKLATYVSEMGYTHVELLPIAEHPFGGSWGYQITNFFAPTNRFGTPDDFAWFVDHLHSKGISVILDWVPAHFPKDPHALARYDGTCLYEHEDPRQGEHKDWGTLIFNYGREQVVTFLISNALYWLDRYHIDGLRVDAVASMLYLDYSKSDGEWVANKYGGKENLEAIAFIKKLNELVHTEFPGVVTIAEESTSWPGVSRPVYTGGLGFTFKWNMGWMHDSLKYMQEDPIYRRWHHDKLTFALLYAFNENFVLVLSHDEVVHLKGSMITKMTGDDWQKFANLRALYSYMYATPGKKLLFMGADIAQWSEWNHQKSLDWELVNYDPNHGINELVKKLNFLYSSEPALYEMCHESKGFQWIDFRDSDNSVISFLRKARNSDDYIVVICNFTPQILHNYRIGVPREGFHEEILNSDSYIFWGANVGNEGGVHAEQIAWHEHMWSISVDIPPLGVLYLKPEPKPVIEIEKAEVVKIIEGKKV